MTGAQGPASGRVLAGRVPWIVGIVGLVAVIGIVLGLVLTRGDSKDSSETNTDGSASNGNAARINEAEHALDKFFQADIAHDLGAMKELACPFLQDYLKPTATGDFLHDRAYTLGTVEQDLGGGGHTQVVFSLRLTRHYGGQGDYEAVMSNEDGSWRLCSLMQGSLNRQQGRAVHTEAPVQQLLQARKTHDQAMADALTCDPLRSRVQSLPPVTGFRVDETRQRMVPGEAGETTTVPFIDSGAGKNRHELAVLERDRGAWKVCDIQPDPDY